MGMEYAMRGEHRRMPLRQTVPLAHEELEDQSARRWHCSSAQHLKSACPYRSDADPPRSAAGGALRRPEKGQGQRKGQRRWEKWRKEHISCHGNRRQGR